MKIPERSVRPVDEASLRDEAKLPAVFHRIKRDSQVFAFIVILIGYCFSFCVLFVGAVLITDSESLPVSIVFILFGLLVLIVCGRGSWALAKGPLVHVLTFEIDHIVWGYVGREQTLGVSEIESINWRVDDDNELTLSLRTRAGKRFTFYYIDRLVPRKQRAELLAYFKACYPDVALSESDHH